MSKKTTRYQAYVLRLWQEMPHESWRIMVQTIPTEECQSFANLESLFAYLYQMTMTNPVAADEVTLPES
jgi:hypothetical protein